MPRRATVYMYLTKYLWRPIVFILIKLKDLCILVIGDFTRRMYCKEQGKSVGGE